MGLREDAERIVRAAIDSALPDAAVKNALSGTRLPERVHVVAVGKAAWGMARAAADALRERIAGGVAITKYGHGKGEIERFTVFEAGHPSPDENSFLATRHAIALVTGLSADDAVVFLLSGGGSALFEAPLIDAAELADVTRQLLASGADIVEINTVRKRLSAVKGGRFAQLCAPARVVSIILSDIVGDPADMIASGPACADRSTSAEALAVVEKYRLRLSGAALELLQKETPKRLDNVETLVIGSVRQLCASAASEAGKLGYRAAVLTDSLTCQAREAGSFLAAIARYHADAKESLAFVVGGETVVRVTGPGLGGRNQELALAAARGIAGLAGTAVISVGSDGTDGPTDAAGGYVDGDTDRALSQQGVDVCGALERNDAYRALARCGGLVVTGPTGTNVNDVAVLLIRR